MNSAHNSTLSVIVVAGVMATMALIGILMARSAHGRNVSPASIFDRRAPAHSDVDASFGQPFVLSATERAVVGVRQQGDEVTFRASGNQWGLSVGLSVAAVLAIIVAATMTDGWLWLLPAAVAACLIVWTALLLRVEVRLNPDGVFVTSRCSRTAFHQWDQIESAQVEVQESSGLWLRDTQRPTVAQGVIRVGGRWLNLPGFRCTMWNSDELHDPLNNTDLKVGVVTRYRTSTVGPWPSLES